MRDHVVRALGSSGRKLRAHARHVERRPQIMCEHCDEAVAQISFASEFFVGDQN
jgi:hypothetical protein